MSKAKVFVIDETNGGGSLDPEPQMSIFLLPEGSVAYEGTHINQELIDNVMDRTEHDSNIEIIIGRNLEGETLLWFRHANPEGIDWADEAAHWQETLRGAMNFPA